MTDDSSRRCGACTYCCKVMNIDELGKPPGLWCQNRTDRGCSIHGSHPATCKSFMCQWLVDPLIASGLRPDKSKVVLAADDDGRLIALCDPNNPLAWKREPMFSLLKQQARATWMTKATVLVKAGKRVWIITPTTEISLGEIDERSPYHIFQNPDGTARVEVLPPPPIGDDVRSYLESLHKASPGRQA
jgi:hypothetical protein